MTEAVKQTTELSGVSNIASDLTQLQGSALEKGALLEEIQAKTPPSNETTPEKTTSQELAERREQIENSVLFGPEAQLGSTLQSCAKHGGIVEAAQRQLSEQVFRDVELSLGTQKKKRAALDPEVEIVFQRLHSVVPDEEVGVLVKLLKQAKNSGATGLEASKTELNKLVREIANRLEGASTSADLHIKEDVIVKALGALIQDLLEEENTDDVLTFAEDTLSEVLQENSAQKEATEIEEQRQKIAADKQRLENFTQQMDKIAGQRGENLGAIASDPAKQEALDEQYQKLKDEFSDIFSRDPALLVRADLRFGQVEERARMRAIRENVSKITQEITYQTDIPESQNSNRDPRLVGSLQRKYDNYLKAQEEFLATRTEFKASLETTRQEAQKVAASIIQQADALATKLNESFGWFSTDTTTIFEIYSKNPPELIAAMEQRYELKYGQKAIEALGENLEDYPAVMQRIENLRANDLKAAVVDELFLAVEAGDTAAIVNIYATRSPEEIKELEARFTSQYLPGKFGTKNIDQILKYGFAKAETTGRTSSRLGRTSTGLVGNVTPISVDDNMDLIGAYRRGDVILSQAILLHREVRSLEGGRDENILALLKDKDAETLRQINNTYLLKYKNAIRTDCARIFSAGPERDQFEAILRADSLAAATAALKIAVNAEEKQPILTILERHSATEREALLDNYQKIYKSDFLVDAKEALGDNHHYRVVQKLASGEDLTPAEHVQDLIVELDESWQIFGGGTTQIEKLKKATKDLSKEEATALVDAYAKLTHGKDLKADLRDLLPGDDEFDIVDDHLSGKPETLEEHVVRVEMRHDHERSGWASAWVDLWSDKGEEMDRAVAEVRAIYDRVVASQADTEEQRRLWTLVGLATNRCMEFRGTKNFVADVTSDVVTTTVLVAGTVATGGLLGSVAAVYLLPGMAFATASTGLTIRWGIKDGIKGSGYDGQNFSQDVVTSAIDGLTVVPGAVAGSAVTRQITKRVGSAVIKEAGQELTEKALIQAGTQAIEKRVVTKVGVGALEGSVDGAVSNASASGIVTGVNPDTWQDGLGAGAKSVLANSAWGGTVGAPLGAIFGGTLALKDNIVDKVSSAWGKIRGAKEPQLKLATEHADHTALPTSETLAVESSGLTEPELRIVREDVLEVPSQELEVGTSEAGELALTEQVTESLVLEEPASADFNQNEQVFRLEDYQEPQLVSLKNGDSTLKEDLPELSYEEAAHQEAPIFKFDDYRSDKNNLRDDSGKTATQVAESKSTSLDKIPPRDEMPSRAESAPEENPTVVTASSNDNSGSSRVKTDLDKEIEWRTGWLEYNEKLVSSGALEDGTPIDPVAVKAESERIKGEILELQDKKEQTDRWAKQEEEFRKHSEEFKADQERIREESRLALERKQEISDDHFRRNAADIERGREAQQWQADKVREEARAGTEKAKEIEAQHLARNASDIERGREVFEYLRAQVKQSAERFEASVAEIRRSHALQDSLRSEARTSSDSSSVFADSSSIANTVEPHATSPQPILVQAENPVVLEVKLPVSDTTTTPVAEKVAEAPFEKGIDSGPAKSSESFVAPEPRKPSTWEERGDFDLYDSEDGRSPTRRSAPKRAPRQEREMTRRVSVLEKEKPDLSHIEALLNEAPKGEGEVLQETQAAEHALITESEADTPGRSGPSAKGSGTKDKPRYLELEGEIQRLKTDLQDLSSKDTSPRILELLNSEIALREGELKALVASAEAPQGQSAASLDQELRINSESTFGTPDDQGAVHVRSEDGTLSDEDSVTETRTSARDRVKALVEKSKKFVAAARDSQALKIEEEVLPSQTPQQTSPELKFHAAPESQANAVTHTALKPKPRVHANEEAAPYARTHPEPKPEPEPYPKKARADEAEPKPRKRPFLDGFGSGEYDPRTEKLNTEKFRSDPYDHDIPDDDTPLAKSRGRRRIKRSELQPEAALQSDTAGSASDDTQSGYDYERGRE